MALHESLKSALPDVLRIVSSFKDDWWIIGSAALRLIGVDVNVADVDVLTSRRDAIGISADLVLHKIEGADRFRSIYRCVSHTQMPIEIMGDLEVRFDGQWHSVGPTSRISVAVEEGVLFVPDAHEQLRLLRLFGRDKDLARAATLVKSGIV